MINRALLAIYLADTKVNEQRDVRKTAKQIVQQYYQCPNALLAISVLHR